MFLFYCSHLLPLVQGGYYKGGSREYYVFRLYIKHTYMLTSFDASVLSYLSLNISDSSSALAKEAGKA